MTMQGYSTKASRNLIRAEKIMLKHAEAPSVLASFGLHKEQPLNMTDTVMFRRVKPFNAGSNEVASIDPQAFQGVEGVTPNTYGIDYVDVSTTLKQYEVLFKLTSKAALMYEDKISDDMMQQTGEVIAEIKEMLLYGEIKGGTTVDYANGSTRAGVNTAISLGLLRQAVRTLETNLAPKVTSRIKSGPDFGNVAVPAGWLVFHSTDLNADIEDLPRFKDRVDYGSAVTPAHDREWGSVGEFRFISSPNFKPFLAAGSASLNGMVAANATNVDVYPMIIMAAEAWGDVALKGHGSTSISPTYLSPLTKTHANPGGKFGYVGADFWASCVRLNENRMVRLEVAATAL